MVHVCGRNRYNTTDFVLREVEMTISESIKRLNAWAHYKKLELDRIHEDNIKKYPEYYENARFFLGDISDLLEFAEAAILALKTADTSWFDKAGPDGNCACWACDMGDSGKTQSSDGHDFYCAVANAHAVLEKYFGEKK